MYPPEQILPPHLPLFNDQNSISCSRFEELHHQLASSSSFYFPNSPYSSVQYSEDHFFNELTWEQLQDRLFIHQQHQPFSSLTDQNTVMQNPCEAPRQGLSMPDQNAAAKKRPMKKDRHSKITTAKGPRDRRMRLSLDVARKFFDLQDVLGYDKASKTVEWLLIQANSAIDEVFQGYNAPPTANTSVSSTHSECEVVSGTEDASATATTAAKKGGGNGKKKAKVVTAQRTKESRKEARERARERTMARKNSGAGADLKQYLEGGCWGQFRGSVEESIGHKEMEDHRRKYGTGGDDISVITRSWNPCCIYPQDAAQTAHVNDEMSEFVGYCGNWEGIGNLQQQMSLMHTSRS